MDVTKTWNRMINGSDGRYIDSTSILSCIFKYRKYHPH